MPKAQQPSPSPLVPRPPVARIPLWLPLLLCLGVFILDFLTPLGFAAGIAYTPVVFCGLWFRDIRAPFLLAILATILIVLGFFVSPPAPTEITQHIVLANRALSIAAVWLVATVACLSKKTEEALRTKQEELQMIFDTVPLILCYKDDRNHILRANKTLADSLNLPVSALEGADTATYFSEFAEKYYQDDLEVINSGKPKLGIIEAYKDGKGALRWVRTDKVPHTDLRTGKRGLLVVAQDITGIMGAEKALHEKTEELQRIFDSVPVGIWYKDDRNNILNCNRHAAESAGKQAEELIGHHTAEFFPEMADRYLADDLEVINSGKPKLGIIERYTPIHGTYGWIRTDKVPFTDPVTGQRVLVAVAQDITPLKQVEQRLEALVEELSESNEQLERFAYVCSHDLQEPLRIIRNYVAMLERHCADTVAKDEKAQRYMGYIVESAERSQQLINDVLTYARLTQETKAHERVNLNEVIGTVIHNLGAAISDKHARVTSDTLPEAMGNPTQFLQLFQNLIGNGLKFCTSVPIVHVGVQRLETGWEFSVRDNGIGIAPEYCSKIFVIFQRLNRRSDYPGTGIGLAICKKIVENYGGEISVDSEPDKGTVFRFTLPGAFPDAPQAPMQEERRQPATPAPTEGGTS